MCSPVTSPSFGPHGPNGPNQGHNPTHPGVGNPSMNSVPNSGQFTNVGGNPAQGGGGIQVQSKGANTLQYMPMQGQGVHGAPLHPEAGGGPGAGDINTPSNVPTTPGGPNSVGGGSNYRFELDFMQAFAEPLTNLESKVPHTKLQYFPNSKAGVSSNSSTLTQTGPRMTGPNPNSMPGGVGVGNPPMGHGPTGPMMNRPPMNVGPGNGNQMNLQINMQMNQGGGGPGPGPGPGGGPGPAHSSGVSGGPVAGPNGPGGGPNMGNGGPPSGFGDFQMFQQQLYSTNQGGSAGSGGNGNSSMGPSVGGGAGSGGPAISAASGPGMMQGPS